MTNTATLQPLAKHILSKISCCDNITKFYVGFSGGVDSHALLFLAKELQEKGFIKDIEAIHVNHNINASSDLWEKHCKNVAANLNIPYRSKSVNLKSLGNLEHNARSLRYETFAKLIGKNEALLLAHHLDDQVETVLMRLFKGTGARGICGIKDIADIHNIKVIRPLLAISKEDILAFAAKHKLDYITDPSNTDSSLDRNYIRHNIVPHIKARWPNALQSITGSVSHIVKQEEYISRFCEDILQKISLGNKLSISDLKKYSESEQHMLLRAWIIKHNIYSPSTKTLSRIFKELIGAQMDKNPRIKIQNIELRRFRGYIYLLPYKKPGAHIESKVWPIGQKTLYILEIDKTLARDDSNLDLTVKFRAGGEKVAGSKTLKKLMYEKEVPPWERALIPIIYHENKLVCVMGLFTAEGFNLFYA